MYVADFHMHTNADPADYFLNYDAYQLIDALAAKGINLAGITHHFKIIFEKEWQDYARKKGITLLPSVELNIEGCDVIIVNAKTDAITSFKALAQYKKNNPKSLIIAPHPHAHFVHALHEKLYQHKALFDAIEISASMPFRSWVNNKAVQSAKQLRLPVIAGSDAHDLIQAGTAKNFIDAKSVDEAIAMIKAGKHRPQIRMSALTRYGYLYPKLTIKKILKRITRRHHDG